MTFLETGNDILLILKYSNVILEILKEKDYNDKRMQRLLILKLNF